jgi:invasion protein IalB
MTSFRTFAALVVFLAPGNAFAQQRITAIYGDWELSCTTASGAGGAKSCGLVQIQDETSAASQFGIGRSKTEEPFKVFIVVPADVWMPGGIKLIADDNTAAITAPFKWCIPTRCLADAELSDSNIKSLRGQKDPAMLTYKTASQADVSIPVSFNGFRDAMEALLKQ